MTDTKLPTVALAAGGTAGHVMVALAIAEALERVAPGIETVFLGADRGTEARLVAAHGRRLEVLPAAPLKRQRWSGRLVALRESARGIPPARRVLVDRSVRLVIGTGGYAAFAPILAARSLGIPCAIHEANALPGLANRILGAIVDRVYLSSEDARSSFPTHSTIVTGTPLRAEVADVGAIGARTKVADRPARVLVTAGSEGSRFLDREAPRLLGALAARGIAVEAWHQAGLGELDPLRDVYAVAGVDARVTAFIDDMRSAYAWADLAIAGCGASTVAELATAGLPSLVVPLAGVADDHQRRNAEAFARVGAVAIADERDWDRERVAATVMRLLFDDDARSTASAAMRALARPDAADVLARDCLEWLAERRA